jgi:ABC-type transport system involved in multi-copper enzyme maturation permease subunit
VSRAIPVQAPVTAPAQLHDAGYQRYAGTRRRGSTRWRVIARHQIAMAWKTWWRFKAALGLAVMVTVVWGGLMYFLSNKLFRGMPGLSWSEAALPMAVEWYCRVAFFLSLVLGAGAIAGDGQSGSFAFFFARSVRPRDYVLGKLAGYGALVAALVAAGPIVLALLRVAVSDTTDDLVAHLALVPRAVLLGAIMTAVYTAVPLGFSAIAGDRRTALALWAAYYLVFGSIASLIGRQSGGGIGALDIPTACLALAFDSFGGAPIYGRRAAREVDPKMALLALGINVAVAIIAIAVRVWRARARGVGGS